MYSAAIISVLTYGCSGWELTPELLRFLNGWNGKRVAFITEREIPEECRDPTFDLVARIKLQRMKHARDTLRAENPTGRCGQDDVGRRTTYGHKNKRQEGTD